MSFIENFTTIAPRLPHLLTLPSALLHPLQMPRSRTTTLTDRIQTPARHLIGEIITSAEPDITLPSEYFQHLSEITPPADFPSLYRTSAELPQHLREITEAYWFALYGNCTRYQNALNTPVSTAQDAKLILLQRKALRTNLLDVSMRSTTNKQDLISCIDSLHQTRDSTTPPSVRPPIRY